jgi:hypothetical protein
VGPTLENLRRQGRPTSLEGSNLVAWAPDNVHGLPSSMMCACGGVRGGAYRELYNQNLPGTIPTEMGDLTALTKL